MSGHDHTCHAQVPGWRFALAIALNLGFTVVEIGFGLRAGSAALLADALHNLTDVAALVIAWSGAWLATRPPSARFTYGLRSTTIYAAFLNATLLCVACGGLGWEAVQRLAADSAIDGRVVIGVAALGIVINGLSALLFLGTHHDLNARGAYLHLLADAAISAGVCLAGLAILRTGWTWLDPAVTLVIVTLILVSTWSLLRESALLGLHGVPPGLRTDDVRALLEAEPDIAAVHDLHVWALSTTDIALTAHLVTPGGHPGDARLDELANRLHHRFGIGHTTFQVELVDNRHACALDAAHAH